MRWTKRHSQNAVAAKERRRIERALAEPEIEPPRKSAASRRQTGFYYPHRIGARGTVAGGGASFLWPGADERWAIGPAVLSGAGTTVDQKRTANLPGLARTCPNFPGFPRQPLSLAPILGHWSRREHLIQPNLTEPGGSAEHHPSHPWQQRPRAVARQSQAPAGRATRGPHGGGFGGRY